MGEGAEPWLSGLDLHELFRIKAKVDGCILRKLAEVERSGTSRAEGATSTEAWVTERFGVSAATARAYTHVGDKAQNMPHLVGSLCAGDLSFDKVRVLADVATPQSDQRLCEQAKESSVRELADVARTRAELGRPSASPSRSASEHDGRYLRFNDRYRSISAQLPSEVYAETKACLETRAKDAPSEGETRWDQRLCDALRELISASGGGSTGNPGTTTSPYVVVVHVPLAALTDGSGSETALAGELEQHGLIDGETARRIACDATLVVALDDDVGHTMYEGRARRFPTATQRREIMRRDRQCRFPGCTNVTFTNVHHIVPWRPGGRTDLDNMALLCLFHHGVVHRKGWTMSGDANAELTVTGPNGRVMTSRPSALWTRVTAP